MSVGLAPKDIFEVDVEFLGCVCYFFEVGLGEGGGAVFAGVVFGEGDCGLEGVADLSACVG